MVWRSSAFPERPFHVKHPRSGSGPASWALDPRGRLLGNQHPPERGRPWRSVEVDVEIDLTHQDDRVAHLFPQRQRLPSELRGEDDVWTINGEVPEFGDGRPESLRNRRVTPRGVDRKWVHRAESCEVSEHLWIRHAGHHL